LFTIATIDADRAGIVQIDLARSKCGPLFEEAPLFFLRRLAGSFLPKLFVGHDSVQSLLNDGKEPETGLM